MIGGDGTRDTSQRSKLRLVWVRSNNLDHRSLKSRINLHYFVVFGHCQLHRCLGKFVRTTEVYALIGIYTFIMY